MRSILGLATLALVGSCVAPTVALAQSGNYAVEGAQLGGETYTGTVRVSRTGDTWRVEWRVGSDSYVGTGIGDDNVLAVSFTGTRPGVALYVRKDNTWQGAWTFMNDRRVSSEIWTAR